MYIYIYYILNRASIMCCSCSTSFQAYKCIYSVDYCNALTATPAALFFLTWLTGLPLILTRLIPGPAPAYQAYWLTRLTSLVLLAGLALVVYQA